MDKKTRQQIALFRHGLIGDLVHRKVVSGVFMLCCVTKQSGSTRSRGPEELVWPSRRFGIGWTRTGAVDSMHSIPSRDAIKGKLARFHKRWPIISAPSRRTTVPFRLPLLSNKLSEAVRFPNR